MKKHVEQKGFSLVELMVVIAIIAILAAVAINMYSDYKIKVKYTSVLASIPLLKTVVAEENTSTTDGPLAGVTRFVSPSIVSSELTYRVKIRPTGVIIVSFRKPREYKGVIQLIPTIVGAGSVISWECKSRNIEQVRLPSTCVHY